MLNYKDRWANIALKLENAKSTLIDETIQNGSFVERPKKIVSALEKFKHSSNQGIIVYSISKAIGGNEKISLFSGLTGDFLGDLIRVYDSIVEVRESERKNRSSLYKLDSYELICIYTTLLMLANKCLYEISKTNSEERFNRLTEVILNFPYLSIPDKNRESFKTLPKTEIAYDIVNRISDYGKILGSIAAIPIANSTLQIDISASVGKNFCAGMHIIDEVHDFLSGEDIFKKKFGNYIFGQLNDFTSREDRILLNEYMKSESLTERDVRNIIDMAINNCTLDNVMNMIKRYMKISKKEFLQISPIEDPESKKFVIDTFDYVADVIERTMKAYHSDVNYVDKLKYLPRDGVLQSRMPCSYFIE